MVPETLEIFELLPPLSRVGEPCSIPTCYALNCFHIPLSSRTRLMKSERYRELEYTAFHCLLDLTREPAIHFQKQRCYLTSVEPGALRVKVRRKRKIVFGCLAEFAKLAGAQLS